MESAKKILILKLTTGSYSSHGVHINCQIGNNEYILYSKLNFQKNYLAICIDFVIVIFPEGTYCFFPWVWFPGISDETA